MAKKVIVDNPIFGSERLDPLYSNPQYYGDSGSQYDRASLMPLDEQRAAAQTGWDSFGNIAGRLVGRTGLSVIESAGMLGYGLPKAIVTGDLNALFDNELSKGFKSLDDALLEKTPFYQSEAEKNAPLFSKEYLTSTNFWGNLIGEGGGFVLGALASGSLIGKGISSAGRLANSMGMVASDAEKIREVANAAKAGESVAEKFISARQGIKAENLASYYTQRIGGNMYEAGVEARGVKEEILRAKREEFEKNNLPGAVPTEEEKATWDAIATKYSNASFGLNLGLLMIDGLNMGRFLKGYKSTNRTVNALREAGDYVEKGTLGKTLDRAGTILGGSLAEAAQEGGQFVTEKMTAEMAKTQQTADATRSFNEYFISTIKGLEKTFGTKEGQESMLAGFLLATPFNIPTAISEGTLDKHGIAAMNNNATGKTFQALLKHNHDNFANQVGEKKDKYAEMNSHILHEDLQRDGFYKYVKSRDDAGRFDDVLDDIGDLKRMNINAFKEAYGEHYDEVARQETLTDLEKQARYYQNTKEEIEAVFNNHQNKEALIEGSVKINNLTDRINRLDTKLTNANLPELIRTNLQTDKLNLINERAAEELKLGEYLSERRTMAEDNLDKEAEAEIEEPEDLAKKETKDKRKKKAEDVVKDFEKGDEVSYNNSKAIIEAVKTDESGKKVFTIVQENGTKIQVDEASLDNAGVEVEEQEEDNDNFETQNARSKDGILEADVFDKEGKPVKWASLNPDDHENSPHLNASDLSLVDLRKKEKGISEDLKDSDFHNSLKIDAEAADKIKEDILNSGVDDYSYEYKKEKNKEGNTQYNIYAKKEGEKATKIGYFLDFTKNFASNGKKDNLTIDNFIKKYLQSNNENASLKADVLNKLKDVNKLITAEEKLDLTKSTYINTRILNSYENNTLADIINSPYAKRWKVNGEFVVAKYSKGSYVLIDDVSTANEKIFNDTVKKPYVQNSVGAQFVIMVKRPNKKGKDFYSFINLKGAPITDRIKNDFVSRLNDPKVDKQSLVQELNESIFIGSKGKSFNVETPQGNISIPVHLYFDTDYQGNIIVKREAKVVDGIKPEIIVEKKLQKAKLTAEEAIENFAYERIPTDTANDIDDIKDKVVTNADKKLWDSFFGFSTAEFTKGIPSLTSLAPDGKTNNQQNIKDDVNFSNKVIKEIINNKEFIEGLTEDGERVKIDEGKEYKYYYNTKTKETYQRVTDISSDKKEGTVNEGIKKTAQGLGNKVDRIYREFFDPNRKKKALNYKDYNIVTEENKKEFASFIKQLEVLKTGFADRGETVYANNIVLYNDVLKVAGTVDVLTIDKFGAFRIYDVKTMRGNQFKDSYRDEKETDDKGKKVKKYYSNKFGKSNYDSHSDQLSIYRILLNNTHGVLAKNLSIIPIELEYEDGDKTTSKLNLLSDYIFNVNKKDEVENLSLSETRATQKVDNAKVQYSTNKLIKTIEEADEVDEEFLKKIGVDPIKFQRYQNLKINDPKHDKAVKDLGDDFTGIEKYFLIEYVKSIATATTATTEKTEQTSSKNVKEEPTQKKPLNLRNRGAQVKPDTPNAEESEDPEDTGSAKPYDEYTETEQQFIEEANQEVKRILNVDVRLEQNQLNFGSFRKGLIYLASKAPKGTLWHEAFHGIFTILSPNEKARVLGIAERVFGKPTAEEIAYLKKVYSERGYKNATLPFLYKKILEEKVADLFQDYMNNKPTTFFGRFFAKLKQLLNYFLGRTEDASFAAFFDEIYSGKYRAISPSVNSVESFKPIGNASGSERELLLAQLTTYYVNRKKYYNEENNNLDSFVKSMLNKIRMGHNSLIEDIIDEKIRNIEIEYEKGKITEEQANVKAAIIDAEIEKKYVRSEINGKEYKYPKYLSKQYDNLIVSEVLDYNDFKKANQFDEDEDEKETYYGENEFEKSIHDTPAGQAIKATMLDMAISDKYFDIKPIDTPGIINNLTFALNGISKDKITETLENLLSPEGDPEESDFSKSLRVVLEEYNTNKAFKRQFQTAFDRCFAQAIKAVSTRDTKKSGQFIRIENNKDHIQQQIAEWRDEVLVNIDEEVTPLEDGTKEEQNANLLKYLGITLQSDIYREPTTQKILTGIRRNIFTPNIKTQQIQGANFLFTDKSNVALLEQLANLNIKYRLDLGELTFRNADGKPMSSIINNSDIIKRLNNIKNRHLIDIEKGESFKNKWGIFIGTKFGDKSSDYKGIDPKAYFLTQLMMYANKDTDGKSSKPYYTAQQPSDKNTTFVFEGKTFTKSRALQATILREEVERQNLQMEDFVKILQDINSLEMSDKEKNSLLTEGQHYVKGQTIAQTLETYNKILNGEIARNNSSVPRAFRYYNIPYVNSELLSIDEINNLSDEYYLELLDDLIAEETGYYIYEKSNGERVISHEVSKFKRFNSEGIDEATGDVLITREVGKIEKTRQTFGISKKEILAIAGVKSEDLDNFLKFFATNDYLNRLLILSEINPDLSQFKNNPAITKRAAGQAASGPNFHDPELSVYDEEGNFVSDDFTFGIIPDRQKIFNSSVKNYEEAETLDAQGAELVQERINRYLRAGRVSQTTSKKNKFNDELYMDWLTLKAVADDNRSLIRRLPKGGSPLKIDKTVGYGTEFYLKTSVKVFARMWNSDFAKPGQTRTITHKTTIPTKRDKDKNIIETKEVVYTETYEATQDTYNGKWYLPIPGREVEWNLMNEMQKNNLSAVFAESAVKKGAKKIAEYVETNLEEPVKNPAKFQFANGNTMSYLDYRQQQETPPDKNTIGDGSQGIQQIDANLSLNYIPEGDDRTIQQIKDDNDSLLLEIKNYQKDLYLKGIESIDIDGKRYSAFVNYIVSALDSSKATDRMKDFFEIGADGKFKFSTSLPMIETKFEELVMAYINNNIARHKVPGEKMILTTSEFYRPMRDANGNILTTYEVEQLKKDDPNIYDKLDSSQDLKAPSIEKDGQKYAEVVVTEEYLEHLGITIQDWVKLKNADPESEEGKIFNKISTFMGYRIPTQAHHSMLACKIVDFMPTHFGSVVVLPAEVTKLSGSDYDVDSLFAQRYEIYKDKDGNIKLADNSEISFRNYLKTNKLAKEYLSQMDKEEKVNLNMMIDDLQEELEPLFTQLGELKYTTLSGKNKSMSDISEEDIEAGMDSMFESVEINEQIDNIKSQIASLKAQVKELEERKILKVKEILQLEDNFNPNMVYNEMLDNRMSILTSHEGRKNINYPAENHFKTLHEKIFDEMEHLSEDDEQEIVYATHSNFFNEWLKAYAGKGSISGSANISKDHAFLQKNDAEIITNLDELWDGELSISSITESDIEIALDANGNLYISKENVIRPKSDTTSNFVSMSVDNGNDQTLYKFNLNSQTMPDAVVGGSIGFGQTRLAVLFKSPVIKVLSGKIIVEDTLLSNKFVDKIQVVSNYINDKFKHIPIKKINSEDIVKVLNRDNYLRIETLLRMKGSDLRNLEGNDAELIAIQASIARIYLNYAQASKNYFTVNTVLNYNREVGRYGYDVYKMQNSIDIIKNSDEFQITGIQDNKFINNVGSILHELTDVIEDNLLSYNTKTNDLVKRIVKSTTKNRPDTASLKFQHALRKEFINFISKRMYSYRFEANKEALEETGEKTFKEFGGVDLSDKDIIRGEKVIEQYNKVRSRIKKYTLGRALKIAEPSESYPFPRLVLESFANVDPIIEKRLANDFQDMLRETDVEIKNLARMMLQHIGAHDNFRYVSGSPVRIVRPMFFESLNQIYKGDKFDTPGLEDLFNYQDEEGNGLSMETFESTLAEMLGIEKSNLTALINEFGKFFFADGRNRQFVVTKGQVFKEDKGVKSKAITEEITGKKTGKTITRTIGYEIKLPISDEGKFPFAPDFFQTIKRPPADQPNGVTRYTLYNKVKISKSKDGKTLTCIYTKVEQPDLIRNEAPKFNTKYYQLSYNENVELWNEGVKNITSKEFKSKSKLEEIRMKKARTEVNKYLEGVEEEDKFNSDEDRELYSGEVNNPLEAEHLQEDEEVTNKEKSLPAATLNLLLKINKLDDFSVELENAQKKYEFKSFDITALRNHQDTLENRESKKQATVTTTKTQKINTTPSSGIINNTLNKPGVVVTKAVEESGPEPAAFSGAILLSEETLNTINENHQTLIASFDAYSSELSKAGIKSVEDLENLQDPMERKKLYKLICKKK